MRVVLVTGISGSGKSIAINVLEDDGYFCIDNLPAKFLQEVIASLQDQGYDRVAVSIDARSGASVADLKQIIGGLGRVGHDVKVLFLNARTDSLVQRYSETRRRHPLSRAGLGLHEALEQEQRMLAPVANAADLTVDTSRLSVHELRELIRERVVERKEGGPSLLFQSFAYRHGVPDDADFVFDARALPNPYWEPSLRDCTGRDEAVAAFMSRHEEAARFLDDVTGFLERWLPSLVRSNRSYLTVAVGCTGGQHRSVYFAEKLAAHFDGRFGRALIRHRDLASRRHE
jgi:UPF0042 nucleotide-binding protein